jgi:hypothetical protein
VAGGLLVVTDVEIVAGDDIVIRAKDKPNRRAYLVFEK